jgi:hypothetical protein
MKMTFRLGELLLVEDHWAENPDLSGRFQSGLAAARAIHHAAHGEAGWRPQPNDVFGWMNELIAVHPLAHT